MAVMMMSMSMSCLVVGTSSTIWASNASATAGRSWHRLIACAAAKALQYRCQQLACTAKGTGRTKQSPGVVILLGMLRQTLNEMVIVPAQSSTGTIRPAAVAARYSVDCWQPLLRDSSEKYCMICAVKNCGGHIGRQGRATA